MASPIGHLAAGAAVWYALRPWNKDNAEQRAGQAGAMLAASAFLALLPDADSALGILFGDFGRYHNNWTHSLFWVPVVGGAASLILSAMAGVSRRKGFLLGALCVLLHDLMDFATIGRGVMLFWPLTHARFQSPILLFYGLHWSQPWNSASHLVTLINEAAWIGLGLALFAWVRCRRRSMLSPAALRQ